MNFCFVLSKHWTRKNSETGYRIQCPHFNMHFIIIIFFLFRKIAHHKMNNNNNYIVGASVYRMQYNFAVSLDKYGYRNKNQQFFVVVSVKLFTYSLFRITSSIATQTKSEFHYFVLILIISRNEEKKKKKSVDQTVTNSIEINRTVGIKSINFHCSSVFVRNSDNLLLLIESNCLFVYL